MEAAERYSILWGFVQCTAGLVVLGIPQRARNPGFAWAVFMEPRCGWNTVIPVIHFNVNTSFLDRGLRHPHSVPIGREDLLLVVLALIIQDQHKS